MHSKRPAWLFLLLILACLSVSACSNTDKTWAVDDDCGSGNNQYFTAGGPPEFWIAFQDPPSHGGWYLVTAQTAGPDPVNYANWYLPVELTGYQGWYRVDAWMPCTTDRQGVAQYWRYDKGTTYGVVEVYHVDQRAGCDSDVALTDRDYFYSNAANSYGGYVKLTDTTAGQCCINVIAEELVYQGVS